jgi:hypothetical protein
VDPLFGAFQRVEYELAGLGDVALNVSITAFAARPLVVFAGAVASSLEGLSLNSSADTVTCFPALETQSAASALTSLGVLSWQGLWSPGELSSGILSGGYVGGIQGGPLALINRSHPALPTVILSPLSRFKSGVMALSASVPGRPLCMGAQGMIESIPAGTSWSFAAVGGVGVGATFDAWGDVLLAAGGKARGGRDAASDLLGYYTDNGAYYYDRTQDGLTYAQTLSNLAAHFRGASVPVRYMQLDSWWYEWGDDHGTSAWRPRVDNVTFPTGVIPALGMPLQMHNRFWSQTHEYANVSWVDSPVGGVGLGESFPAAQPAGNQYGLYARVMREARDRWGLAVYEQDWLTTQFSGMLAPQRDVDSAEAWLAAMDRAARDLGLTILYCMPLPADYLTSSALPAVVGIRVSDDYFAYLANRKPTWSIGVNSMLARALGLRPSKDVFWSSVTNAGYWHSGFSGHASEPNALLTAIAATLSAGQVAFGDALGAEDAALLARTCDASGRILAPDEPAVPIDRFFASPPACPPPCGFTEPLGASVVFATTQLARDASSALVFSVALAANLSEPYALQPADVGLPDDQPALAVRLADCSVSTPCAVYNASSTTVLPFSAAQPLELFANLDAPPGFKQGQVPFELWAFFPVLVSSPSLRFALLGELGTRFVPMSGRRFSQLEVDVPSATASLEIEGAAGESVSFTVATLSSPPPSSWELATLQCTLGASGAAQLVVDLASGAHKCSRH